MLRHKEQIDILEDYLGEHAKHFEWSGVTHVGYTVFGHIDRFKVTLAMDAVNDKKELVLRFYPTKTGAMHTICSVPLEDPEGPRIIEERIGLLFKALTPGPGV